MGLPLSFYKNLPILDNKATKIDFSQKLSDLKPNSTGGYAIS
jgi:hypothetical protein